MAESSVGLAELIRQVRRDLLLDSTDADALPLLSIEEVDLELAIRFTATAKAGINIQVVELGGSGEHEKCHTVRIKMVPLLDREQRLAALKKDSNWQAIVDQQAAFLKEGQNTPSPDDFKIH